MKLSVVTIVRNAPEDLERTIQSVLEQSTRPFEHVVVDGASTDRTLEIAKAHAASNPQWVVLRSERDAGIGDALNKGTGLAAGDWVVCMNAGDRFHDADSIARIVSALEGADPRTVLYGDVLLLYPNFSSRTSTRHQDLESARTFWNPLCHQAMAVPREAMAKHPFDPKLRFSMDLELWLTLLDESWPFVHLDHPLCQYAMGGVSSKQENFPAIIEEHLRVYRKHGRHQKETAAILLRIRLALERLGGGFVRTLIEQRRRKRLR